MSDLSPVDQLFQDYEQHCVARTELGAKLCEAMESVVPSALGEVAAALLAHGHDARADMTRDRECGRSGFAGRISVKRAAGFALMLEFYGQREPPRADATGYALIDGRRKEVEIPLDLPSLTRGAVVALVVEQYRAVLFGG